MKINNQTIFFSIPDVFTDNILLEKGKTKMIQGVQKQWGLKKIGQVIKPFSKMQP